MIEEMIEELRSLESEEEIADAIVEISTALRQAEVDFYKAVGEVLQTKNELVIQRLSGKRKEFFEKAKLIAQYWEQIQGVYSKDKSLSDLIAYIKKEILKVQKEQKKSKSIPINIIQERIQKHQEAFYKTYDRTFLAKKEEDEDLLKEVQE